MILSGQPQSDAVGFAKIIISFGTNESSKIAAKRCFLLLGGILVVIGLCRVQKLGRHAAGDDNAIVRAGHFRFEYFKIVRMIERGGNWFFPIISVCKFRLDDLAAREKVMTAFKFVIRELMIPIHMNFYCLHKSVRAFSLENIRSLVVIGPGKRIGDA